MPHKHQCQSFPKAQGHWNMSQQSGRCSQVRQVLPVSPGSAWEQPKVVTRVMEYFVPRY